MLPTIKNVRRSFFTLANAWKHKLANAHRQFRDDINARRSLAILSSKQRKKIDKYLCELIQRDDVITSGKLHFLNFEDVRKYLGYKWRTLEPIITSITEDVIAKYTDPRDLAFRYKEDEFIIIFSTADKNESSLKCKLIATEINKLLFEEQTKRDEVHDLGLEHKLMQIDSQILRKEKSMIQKIDTAFDDIISYEQLEKQLRASPHTRIEVPEKEEPVYHPAPNKDDDYKLKSYLFVPVEGQKNKNERIYLTILDLQKSLFNPSSDPVLKHNLFFLHLHRTDTSLFDLFLLQKTIETLREHPNINCIALVHYQTLSSPEMFHHYLEPLLTIDEDIKSRLIICVQGLASGITGITLERITSSIKHRCHYLFASIQAEEHYDYDHFANAGFSGICVTLTKKKQVPHNFLHFKQHLINSVEMYNLKTMIIIGEGDKDVLRRGDLNGFDFIGGMPIGNPVKISTQ